MSSLPPTPPTSASSPSDPALVKDSGQWIAPLRAELGRWLIGQHELVDRLLVCLLVRGHILLEGVPGLAKTLALKTLAALVDAKFARIQFTPDMLPADIVGTEVFDPRAAEFRVKRGPVFANFILADEINRAPAKVQSALLEAMQEKQVTIGDQSFPLPRPFLVMATQNPLEQEGTYPLPEAQLDRFLMKVIVGYPNETEELRVLDLAATVTDAPAPSPVLTLETIRASRDVAGALYLDDRVKHYIVRLVHATRRPDDFGVRIGPFIKVGASPRATIGLALAARAHAFLGGRGYVTPNDVKTVAPDILRHRVAVTYEAEAEGMTSESLVERILNELPVPVKQKPPSTADAETEARAAEILARVRRMELQTLRLVDDAMAGRYASVFKGRGMDFDRVRNYVAGDDVRTIDWNVTARTGNPYVKLFTEERELTILLVLDVSASSDFGSAADSKRELSAEAAGVLAMSAVRNRDKVGLVLFSEEVELYIPPAKGRTHILRLIREALFFQPEKRGTNIGAALDFANRVVSRRAIVFLVSDFNPGAPLTENLAALRKKMRITARHHDVIAVSVADPREGELPDVGRLCVEDSETGAVVELNTRKPSVREAWREQYKERRTKTATAIRSSGVDLLEFSTDANWLPALVGFFRNRRHRMG